MRGCHHDLTREGKGKGVTKAGTGRRKGKGEGRERWCTVTGLLPIHHMVSFPNSAISSHASLCYLALSLSFRTVRTCDDVRPQSGNLIPNRPPLLHYYSFTMLSLFLLSACPGFFFSRTSILGVTATCHGSRGSRPDVVPCSGVSGSAYLLSVVISFQLDASLKRI
jgi:hypothetical protein